MSPLLFALLIGCDESSSPSQTLSVRIITPQDASTSSGEVSLIGLVQGGGDELAMWWESDLTGPLDVEVSSDDDGVSYSTATLEAGDHVLWLYAEEGDQLVSDEISLTISDEYTPSTAALSVELLSPANGSSYDEEDQVLFLAKVTGDLSTMAVSWSSNLDGSLNIDSEPDGDGLLEGSTRALSLGTHTINVSASEGEETEQDSISVTITSNNLPPEISISLPTDGSSFDEGEQLYLKSTVSDIEDIPEDLEVSWSSNIDGHLVSENAEKDGTSRCNAPLTAGDHVLTATVTDPNGATAEDTTSVTITGSKDKKKE
ncbi:MAG: hypothetical protein ACI8RZ_005418 [Myxococcota bacterium]|jgi:hypothetical protein